jgi:hypothetical protein
MTNQLHSHYRTPLTSAAFSFALCLVLSVPLHGQEDPFGGNDPFGGGAMGADPGNAFGTPAVPVAPPDASAIREEDPDPIIRMLRSHPPKTPAAMSDALTWTIRLRRWDEVGRLLDRVSAAGWTLEQKAEIARRVGSAALLRMRNPDAILTDAQKKVASDLFHAPGELARNPQWIEQTIDKLASSSLPERQVARLRLHDAGALAIERLVNRLLAGDSKVAPEVLAASTYSFGDEGIEALRSAFLVADAVAAARVPLALADLPIADFGTEIGAALVSRVMPVEQQQLLGEKLGKKYGAVPTAKSIEQHLTKRFDDELGHYQLNRQVLSDVNDFVWRPGASGVAIQRVEVNPSDKALERVARLAAHRMQLQSVTNEGLAGCAAVLLQRAYKVRPQLHAAEGAAQVLAIFPPEVNGDFSWWQQVYNQCTNWQLHGGAVRTLQSMAEAIVRGDFDPPSEFLAKLLRDPRPAIRYTALELFERIDPKASYFGNEWAVETAIEMSRLGSGPRVLVIGLQSELRQAAQQLVSAQTGAEVSVVNSGAAALKVLDEPYPTEMIMVVDRVADQSISQLIQRLRRSRRGSSLPIAVLTEQLYSYERDMMDETPGVITSVLSRNPEQMRRVLTMLERNLDTAPLTASDRFGFVSTANRFLARIAADREHYAFYPLAQWKNALSDTSGSVSPEARISLLSGIGSADSQRQIIEIATQPTLDEQQRLNAARAFARSVRQFGVTLQRSDILQTYKIYNQLGPHDPVAAKAIGVVLDVIEANAGKTPWPEGF